MENNLNDVYIGTVLQIAIENVKAKINGKKKRELSENDKLILKVSASILRSSLDRSKITLDEMENSVKRVISEAMWEFKKEIDKCE